MDILYRSWKEIVLYRKLIMRNKSCVVSPHCTWVGQPQANRDRVPHRALNRLRFTAKWNASLSCLWTHWLQVKLLFQCSPLEAPAKAAAPQTTLHRVLMLSFKIVFCLEMNAYWCHVDVHLCWNLFAESMVLFDNINVNQEVEVKWHGDIRKGKVRYKGPINGYRGDWVGVELYANGTNFFCFFRIWIRCVRFGSDIFITSTNAEMGLEVTSVLRLRCY